MTARLSALNKWRLKNIRARNEIVIKVQVHGATTWRRVQEIKSFPILEITAEMIGIELRGEIHGVLDKNAVVGAFAAGIGVCVDGKRGCGVVEGVVAGVGG